MFFLILWYSRQGCGPRILNSYFLVMIIKESQICGLLSSAHNYQLLEAGGGTKIWFLKTTTHWSSGISMKISYFTGKCIPLDQYTCLQRLLLCDFHLSYTLNSIFERIFNNMQLQDFFYLQHAGPVCRYKLQERTAKKLTLSISFLYSYIAAESY